MKKKIADFLLILLAGGRSSRMGTPKGLLDYQGHPWLLEQLRRFKAVSGRWAIIVLGFQQEQYFERIPWLKTEGSKTVKRLGLKISTTVNPTPEQGQFSSLQSAIAFLKDKPKGFPELRTRNSEFVIDNEISFGAFLLPVDVPCPGKEVFEKLVRAFYEKIDAVIPQYQSKSGHPVLLSADFLHRLAEVPPLSPEARLDLQIRALPKDQTAFIPVDDEQVNLNMNTIKEFNRFS